MKLDIGYTFVSQGSADIKIDEVAFTKWCETHYIKNALPLEAQLVHYLNTAFTRDELSELIGWGEEVLEVGDVDILEEKTNNE